MQNSRAILVSSAIEAFADNGYRGTTTREIAKAAGVSPGALYSHFESKEELLCEICIDGHEELLDVLCSAREGEHDAVSGVLACVRASVEWYVENRSVARVIEGELRFLGGDARRKVAGIRQKLVGVYVDALELGRRSGEVRGDVEGPLVAILIIGMLRQIITGFSPYEASLEMLKSLFADAVKRLIVP